MAKFYCGQDVIYEKDSRTYSVEYVYALKDGIQEYRISCDGKMKIAREETLKALSRPSYAPVTSPSTSQYHLNYGFVRACIGRYKLYYLLHFTHIDNLSSVMVNGLLPKNKLSSYKDITDREVQAKRSNVKFYLTGSIKVPLHDCVPLYMSWRTPTLYKLLHSGNILNNDIVFILVDTQRILCSGRYNYCFTDGNAASHLTHQYILLKNLEHLDWSTIKADHWGGDADKIRKKNAEFLVYPKIEPRDFYKIIVYNDSMKKNVSRIVEEKGLNMTVEDDARFYEWPKGFNC